VVDGAGAGGDPHVVCGVGVDAVQRHVRVRDADPVPGAAVVGGEHVRVPVHQVAGANAVEVDRVDPGALPDGDAVPGPRRTVLEGVLDTSGVARDVDVRLVGVAGHRHVDEVVRHVVGRGVVD
jgi:hypothetical protein